MIPSSDPGIAIRRAQQGSDFLGIEEGYGPFHLALVRHGENALAVMQPGWLGHRDISEEGADRGKPDVSGPDGVAARRFDMIEEVRHHVGIDVGHLQLRRALSAAGSGIADQQAECQSALKFDPLSASNIDPLGGEQARRCVALT